MSLSRCIASNIPDNPFLAMAMFDRDFSRDTEGC